MGEPNDITDKRIRALATARQLRVMLENPRTEVIVDRVHADTFHSLLATLEDTGIDAREFYVPHGEIRPGPRQRVIVDRDVLLLRVSSLLEYLTIKDAVLQLAAQLDEEPARMIGYLTPTR